MADSNMATKNSDVFSLLLNNIEKEIPVSTVTDSDREKPVLTANDSSTLNERLIRTLEKHIFFLEEEVRRKDAMISNLISITRCNNLGSSHDLNVRPTKNQMENDYFKHNGCLESKESKDTLLNDEDAPLISSNSSAKTITNTNDKDKNNNNKKWKRRKRRGDNNNNNIQNQERNQNQINDDDDSDKYNNNHRKRDTKKDKKITCIIGDSMIKNVKGWEINKKLQDDFVIVKSFSGATSSCMEHYMVPSMEKKPDNVILHVGTNDLKSVDTANKIAGRIVDLAVKCVRNFSVNRVVVSGIVQRGDNLRGKAKLVNDIVRGSCLSRNIPFICNENINLSDLNNSKLHLNGNGSKTLASNFLDFISKA